MLIGYSIWWLNTPEQILQAPGVLSSPGVGSLIQMVKDTFINNVCHEHQVPVPCECGENVNMIIKDVFGQDMSESEIRRSRAISFATMFVALSMAILLADKGFPTEDMASISISIQDYINKNDNNERNAKYSF